jgi:ankyrin repeat protein
MDKILAESALEAHEGYSDDDFEYEQQASTNSSSKMDVLKAAAAQVSREEAIEVKEKLQIESQKLKPMPPTGSKPSRMSDIDDMLVDTADEIDEYDENNELKTEFLIGCYRNDKKLVENLIDKSETKVLKSIDKHGWSPLHIAASKGNLAVCEILLNHKSIIKRINLMDKLAGFTALHLACIGGHYDIVRKLEEFGADRTKRNNLNDIPVDCIPITIEGKKIKQYLSPPKEEAEGKEESKERDYNNDDYDEYKQSHK